MRVLKKDIFISNLFLIDFCFIMPYPSTCPQILDPFWLSSHVLKFEL